MSKSKWVDNKDKRPKKEGWYLVKITGSSEPYDVFEFKDGAWYNWESGLITHWMKIPKAPKNEDKSNCKTKRHPKPRAPHWQFICPTRGNEGEVIACSECGNYINNYNVERPKICPKCGAEMEKSDD